MDEEEKKNYNVQVSCREVSTKYMATYFQVTLSFLGWHTIER